MSGASERLSRDARRRGGVYYTPAAGVEYIVEHTLGPLCRGRGARHLQGLRVLDPACGEGAFLLGAYRYLLDRLVEQGARPGPEERLRILGGLHGVDVDGEAVRRARLSLGEVLVREGLPAARVARVLEAQVRQGDALRGALPCDESGGFDAILMNPPYRNGVEAGTRLGKEERAALGRRYACARGTFDLCVLFQELALRLLRPGGRAGFIAPNKFLAARYAEAFRAHALGRSELRLLADLSQADLFPDASVYPVVCVLERSERPRASYEVELHRFGPGLRLISRCAKRVTPARLLTWSEIFSGGGPLVERLRAENQTLGALFDVSACATTEEAYQLRGALVEGAPDEACFAFVTSGLVQRYASLHGARPLRYLGRRYLCPYLPARALGERRLRQCRSPKLLLAGMARGLRGLIDDGRLAGAVPVVQVLSRGPDQGGLRGLLGVLNSRLATWLFRQSFASLSLSGGYLRIGAPELRSLPLPAALSNPAPERRRLARLQEAVERRLALAHAGGAERLDAEIDLLTYELYRLTDDEITMIEREEAV